MDGTIRLKTHPFHAERTGLETRDIKLHLRYVTLAGLLFTGRYAQVVVTPSPLCNTKGRVKVFSMLHARV
jgi:hypothetical protein